MQSPPLDPPVADTAPTDRVLTGYDEQHLVTICACWTPRGGADWQEVAKLVLHIDPVSEPHPRAARVGNPSGAGALDDGERLPPPPARRRPPLNSFLAGPATPVAGARR